MKNKTLFECNQCGERYSKWQGKCGSCNAWNSLLESQDEPINFKAWNPESSVISINKVMPQENLRQTTHIDELDRVLGGGLVLGSIILFGGDPGIGKSTLLLQLLSYLAATNKVLYVTGEESIQQIATRATRLKLKLSTNLQLLSEIRIENILSSIQENGIKIAVVDSIQTVYSDQMSSAPGSVSQVRECASMLTRIAKNTSVTIILVGHVTKDGALAGPRVLEHIVDTVLYFEGEQHSSFRIIRSSKNRFGAVNELGLFAMTDAGMTEVKNPSAIFLSSYRPDIPGSCILISQEGTRPILIEIQALVDQAYSMPPKRLGIGLDGYRLNMLIAIIQRHIGVQLHDQDIYVNIVGGLKITEPAIDLAAILAIISSVKRKALQHKLAVCGEVGLAGEIRAIQKGQERIKEAIALGFKKIIIPAGNMPKDKIHDIEIFPATDLKQVYQYVFC